MHIYKKPHKYCLSFRCFFFILLCFPSKQIQTSSMWFVSTLFLRLFRCVPCVFVWKKKLITHTHTHTQPYEWSWIPISIEIEGNMPLIKWNVETLTGTYFFWLLTVCLLILLDYYLNYFRHHCHFCETFFSLFFFFHSIHDVLENSLYGPKCIWWQFNIFYWNKVKVLMCISIQSSRTFVATEQQRKKKTKRK